MIIRIPYKYYYFIIIFLSYRIKPYIVDARHGYNPQLWQESQNLSKWLSSTDLCIISNSTKGYTDIIHKDCVDLSVSRGEKIKPIRCQIGNSWPSKSGHCSAEDIPYSERTSLRQSLSNYDNPSEEPLEECFHLLSKEKGALLLVGDSVMQQFFSAIACELERENVWKDPSKFTNTDEVQYVDKVSIRFLPVYHFVNGKWDKIANAAMHHLNKSIERILPNHDSLTVLINVGLHYVSTPVAQFSKEDYYKQVTMVLKYLNSFAEDSKDKKIRIIWRETSAQHFPTSNGYWPGVKYASSMKLQCVPINDTSPEADWRNNYVHEIIETNKFKRVRIIPFYDITVPLWSLHVNGNMRDCTHFCYTPMLYQYLFHALLQEVKFH